MYLNVNLTPPQSGGAHGGGEGGSSCAPKTPEILNSLISLSTTPLSSSSPSTSTSSFANYSSQGYAGDLMSPTTTKNLHFSPTDEIPLSSFQSGGGGCTPTSTCAPQQQMSPSCSSDPGGCVGSGSAIGGASPCGFASAATISGVFKGFPRTPSPPELPSPVNTVEATKSALIKEGLKIQIKSKLQAAGLEPSEILTEKKVVKEEVSDSGELTPQDEERRMRRRERNKIAATKCRNKKKEKTVILMSESESVEDQNHRLKSEIQRLTSEKMKLEKLLDDPNHVASCRHSCGRSSHSSHAPLVVVTSPDAPEQLLPTSSGEGLLRSSSAGVSDHSTTEFSFCSRSVSSPQEQTFTSDSSSPSYVNLSPSTISPLSIPNVSPPHSVTGKQLSSQTSPSVLPSYLQTPPPQYPPITEEAALFALSVANDAPSQLPSLSLSTVDSITGISPSLDSAGPSPSTSSSRAFVTHKPTKLPPAHHKRAQPYSLRTGRLAKPQPQPPPPPQAYSSVEVNVTTQTHDLLECRDDYGFHSIIKDELPNVTTTTESFAFEPSSRNGEYLIDISASTKPDYSTGKLRSPTTTSQCRYTPYDRSNRQYHHHQQQQPQHQQINTTTLTNVCPIQNPGVDAQSVLDEAPPYLQTNCNPFLCDVPQGHFYASCSYENI